MEDKTSEVKNEMYYCVELNAYFSEVDDFFEEWNTDHERNITRPYRLFECEVVSISLDADQIVQEACEELHEDAFDQCDVTGLQKVLDEWAKKQTGAKTYYPDYSKYVELDWDKKKDMEKNKNAK